MRAMLLMLVFSAAAFGQGTVERHTRQGDFKELFGVSPECEKAAVVIESSHHGSDPDVLAPCTAAVTVFIKQTMKGLGIDQSPSAEDLKKATGSESFGYMRLVHAEYQLLMESSIDDLMVAQGCGALPKKRH